AAEPTAAPAAGIQALPSPTAKATTRAMRSADTNATAAPPAPAQAQGPNTFPQPTTAPAAGYIPPPPIAPVTTAGSEAPGTARLDQPALGEPQPAAPQAAIRPIRLVEVGLAGLALLLGLGALWVRRRER